MTYSSREIWLFASMSIHGEDGAVAHSPENPIGWVINPSHSRRSALRALDFQDDPEGRAGSLLHMPSPRLVLWHAAPVVFESVVAPVAAYYCVLLIAGFRGALIGALAWSYLIIARRLVRRERVSTLLLLGTVLLTMRTVISFLTGSVFLYFIQPTASTFVASLVLLGSALLGRPFTQRFTHDFCPLTPALLARPTVHRFFVRVSFLWAIAMFLNGAVVLWLLLTASAGAFPLERTAISLSLTAAAIFFSVTWFTRSMRRDGITVRFGGPVPFVPLPVPAP